MEKRPENAEEPSPQERREAQGELPMSEAWGRIDEARAGNERLVASLTRLWDGVVEASTQANIDDEHDPEGATVAFERAQLRDALKQARSDLEELDRAAERLRTGVYWVCERCGDPIPGARLAARPTAARCVGCAGKPL